jgi:hypothetical protein
LNDAGWKMLLSESSTAKINSSMNSDAKEDGQYSVSFSLNESEFTYNDCNLSGNKNGECSGSNSIVRNDTKNTLIKLRANKVHTYRQWIETRRLEKEEISSSSGDGETYEDIGTRQSDFKGRVGFECDM